MFEATYRQDLLSKEQGARAILNILGPRWKAKAESLNKKDLHVNVPRQRGHQSRFLSTATLALRFRLCLNELGNILTISI
jgi:hypothetical protein